MIPVQNCYLGGKGQKYENCLLPSTYTAMVTADYWLAATASSILKQYSSNGAIIEMKISLEPKIPVQYSNSIKTFPLHVRNGW